MMTELHLQTTGIFLSPASLKEHRTMSVVRSPWSVAVRGGQVKITRNMSSKFYPDFIPIYGYMVLGVSPAAGQKKRPV